MSHVFRACVLALLIVAPVAAWTDGPTERANATRAVLASLPLVFEANDGQTDGAAKFLARGRGYRLFLEPAAATLALTPLGSAADPLSGRTGPPASTAESAIVRLTLVGASTSAPVRGVERLSGVSHYLIGNDRAQWRTNVPTYAKVQYDDVYPAIDLVYYGHEGRLEYDFVVAPGGDPRGIRFRVDGAGRVDVDETGDLVVDVGGRTIRLHAPVIYQQGPNGTRSMVAGGYVVHHGHEVTFQIAAYDTTRPLVIDPVLVFSTYLGGTGSDVANGVALDAAGNIYVVGTTASANFPTSGGVQSTLGGSTDVFVTKLDPSGASIVYSTYLGGSGAEEGLGIAVDATGHAYVVGYTTAANWPTASPLQAALSGASDAFVAKLDPTGAALVYSTYLGGAGDERANGIALDAAGAAHVMGSTTSTDFPTASAFQATYGGGLTDAFVAKLNASGSALVYSTYLGGNDVDDGLGIAVDAAGSAYAVGGTISADFPTTAGVVQPGPAFAGVRDGFVTKLSTAGSVLYSTYLGGTFDDFVHAVAVDSAGHAYVTGRTFSSSFPVVSAFQYTLGGGQDAFVTKLNPTGSALVYSTFLGGSGTDIGWAIAIDASGKAYVTGLTQSFNFPTAFALQSFAGSVDAFVSVVAPSGSALVYSTYLGGSGDDRGLGIAVDAAANAYVVGQTSSTDFPTAAPLQAANAGGVDAFVAKLGAPAATDVSITKSDAPDPVAYGAILTYSIVVTNRGPADATGVIVVDELPVGTFLSSVTPSQGFCSISGPTLSTLTCYLGNVASGASASVSVGVQVFSFTTVTNTATVFANEPDPNLGNNAATTTTAVNLSTVLFPGGGQRTDVNEFLQYAQPTDARTELPPGTTSYEVWIFYGNTIDPATFRATLNGVPVTGFIPVPGTNQVVTIPLVPGRNVLVLEVQGVRTDGRRATDRDRLTFVVH